jgi:hypothetical protein
VVQFPNFTPFKMQQHQRTSLDKVRNKKTIFEMMTLNSTAEFADLNQTKFTGKLNRCCFHLKGLGFEPNNLTSDIWYGKIQYCELTRKYNWNYKMSDVREKLKLSF